MKKLSGFKVIPTRVSDIVSFEGDSLVKSEVIARFLNNEAKNSCRQCRLSETFVASFSPGRGPKPR
jgi:hypothetical protein